MTFPRLKSSFLVLLALAVMVPVIHAQNYGQRNYSGPFIDFDEFNPNFQFFAPLDNTHFGDFTPNMGWYFTWDKINFKTARPRSEEAYGAADDGWGKRIQLGFMRADNTGWSFGTTTLSGPNFYEELIVERNNRVAEDESGGGGGGGGGGDDQQPPSQDDNNPITGQRDYILRDSINAISLSGWELNRTWRIKENDKGRIWEPFVGIRYDQLVDQYEDAEYNRYDDVGLPVPPIPDPNDPTSPGPEDAAIEEYIRERANFRNDMFGGQLGLRWYQKQSHWLLSSELRFFGFHNNQTLHSNRFVEITTVDVGLGEEPTTATRDEQNLWSNNNEFVWGGEL
ncbi:MAG: hypothetical protein HOB73_16510, partial [Planctomycetaceae bacterium]|nr:hypothetical protein [Planctomycetaceae bacterium]